MKRRKIEAVEEVEAKHEAAADVQPADLPSPLPLLVPEIPEVHVPSRRTLPICPGCGRKATRATSTQGKVQYRRCVLRSCSARFKVVVVD